jgi:hypothetical protein
MANQNTTSKPETTQELFRLKVNNHTILETGDFGACLDQAWHLVHQLKMPASGVDILSLDPAAQLWISVWEVEPPRGFIHADILEKFDRREVKTT